MITIRLLGTNDLPSFVNYTYLKYRIPLLLDHRRKNMMAIGAFDEKKPVGLCLSRLNETLKKASLSSIFVCESYRNQGVGTRLLQTLEQRLAKRIFREIEAEYICEPQVIKTFEPILKKLRWKNPVTCMYIVQVPYRNLPSWTWINKYQLPEDIALFPWHEIKDEEKEAIKTKKNQPGWYGDDLDPFTVKRPEMSISQGLRHKNTVIGWCITERMSSDKLSYHKLFIAEEFQNTGFAMKLLYQSIQLQARADITYGCFAVKADNHKMMRFYQKHMQPYADSVVQKVMRKKRLL